MKETGKKERENRRIKKGEKKERTGGSVLKRQHITKRRKFNKYIFFKK